MTSIEETVPQEVRDEYEALRVLPDGRIIGVARLMYHWTLRVDLDWSGYAENYCFPERLDAHVALLTWDGTGDPGDRWVRHPKSGRRRNLETGEEYHQW